MKFANGLNSNYPRRFFRAFRLFARPSLSPNGVPSLCAAMLQKKKKRIVVVLRERGGEGGHEGVEVAAAR